MQLKSFLIRTAMLLLIPAAISCSQVKPVNEHASPEARQVLEFLHEISGEYTLSGQHNFVWEPTKYHRMAHELTGKTPAVWGCDFSFNVTGDDAHRYQHCGPVNLIDLVDSFHFHQVPPDILRNRMVDTAIAMWERGSLVTLMWHHCFPTEGDTCTGSSVWAMENRPDSKTWDSLVTRGTALNTDWQRQLDIILPHLQRLQDNNVPVLWRPYHEMNGVWFWWCNQKGEDGFSRLWRMMYDYITVEKELNNLIWVWNTNAPRDRPGDEAWPYEDFYPGDACVDVLAADVYRKDYKQSHHDDLLALAGDKPIALGEVGGLPDVTLLEEQPYWSWFMTWGYFMVFRDNTVEHVRELYNHPRVLTLDEIGRDAKGNYRVKIRK